MMQPEQGHENNSTNDLEKRWEVQSTFVETDPSKDGINTVSAGSPFSKWANAGFPHDMFDLEEDDIVAITNVWKSPVKSSLKNSSSESVNGNCPSSPQETPDEVYDDSNMCKSRLNSPLLPTAVDGGSQEQSVARDGFNEAPEMQDYSIAWVSDGDWPKSRICKRAKNYRCSKKIGLKKGGKNAHGTKPYDRTSTTASIKLPRTSIIWPIKDYKTRPLSEKSQPSTSTYSYQERTDVRHSLKPDSVKIESTDNRNQTTSIYREPRIVELDNRTNEQSQALTVQTCNEKTESDKSSNIERGSHNGLNISSGDINTPEKKSPSLSSSPTSTRLVICEESPSSNESIEGSPKKNCLSYEDETGKSKKLTHKHNFKDSPGYRQKLLCNIFQSDAYNHSSNSNTLNHLSNTTVSNQSSTSHSCHENKSITVSSSSENMSEISEYSISEPHSRINSSGTINLRISSEYFSDSSSSYLSSPSATSPVLMSRKPTNYQVIEEKRENTDLLNKNIEELRSKYEEQIANRKNENNKEIGYLPLTIPHYNCHGNDNGQYIDWSPGEYHNSYYCYQTSPVYNPRAYFGIVEDDSQQGQPKIEISQGFLPHSSRPNSSLDSPKSEVGKNKYCRSRDTSSDSSSSSESSYDSTGAYTPMLLNAPELYYHDTDPLGLCEPSPGSSGGEGQITKQNDVKWPDTPRPEYYNPRPGFYSFWEGSRRSQNSPISPTLNFNISQYESGTRELWGSSEFRHGQSPSRTTTPSLDDALLSEEHIRREIYQLVESIAFIKHKETVLLDAVEELERERWILEGRLSSLIEKPLENGNSHKEDYD